MRSSPCCMKQCAAWAARANQARCGDLVAEAIPDGGRSVCLEPCARQAGYRGRNRPRRTRSCAQAIRTSFMVGNRRDCYPLTITDFTSRYLLAREAQGAVDDAGELAKQAENLYKSQVPAEQRPEPGGRDRLRRSHARRRARYCRLQRFMDRGVRDSTQTLRDIRASGRIRASSPNCSERLTCLR